MPSTHPNWLKGTFPEWLVVGLIGLLSWFAVQFYDDQKLFRRETSARLSLIEKQLAILEYQIRKNP